jgi:peptide/nickel transport system substrate-binding protein
MGIRACKVSARSRRIRVLRAAPVVSAVVALVLSAAATAQVSPSALQKQAAHTVKQGGTLRILGDVGVPFNCNFNGLQFSINYVVTQWGFVYEPLVITNAFYRPGVPREYLWLASGYRWSADNQTVTFTIRKGVKWSDGQPFTAADVVFTFNLIKKFPALDVAGAWQALGGIRQQGADQVVVSIKRGHIPGFNAIASNTYIVPQHIYASIKDPTKYVDRHPVGTGPFTIQQCSPQVIVYQKNPNYWQPGRPYIDKIVMPDYTSNDSANHDINSSMGDDALGLDFIPNITKAYIARDPAHRHFWFPPVNNWSLVPNLKNPLLSSVLVRQAISYAVDRKEVAQKAEFNFTLPASQTGNILPFKAWYNRAADASHGYYKHNPAKAVSLLKEAGFTRGSDGIFRTKTGQKLTVTLIHVGAYSDSVAATTVMAKQLRDVGFDAQPESLAGTVYGSRVANGQFTLAWSQVSGSVTPFYEYRNMLYSKNSAPLGKPAASNYERFSSPEVDKLIDDYGATRDPKVQHQIINQIQKVMVTDVPVIPVLQGVVWNEWSDKTFVGWATPKNPYINPCGYCTADMGIGVVLTRIHLR